jgi:hypothetical protein
MSLPLAQLNTLLTLPLVTGRLVGGMKALPEEILVGLGTQNLIHRTPGTKTRDSAKVCTLNLYSFLLGSSLGFACFVSWWTSSAALLALLLLSLLIWFFLLFFTLALAFTLV